MKQIIGRLSSMADPSRKILKTGVRVSCLLMSLSLAVILIAPPFSGATYPLYNLSKQLCSYAYPVMFLTVMLSGIVEERICAGQ